MNPFRVPTPSHSPLSLRARHGIHSPQSSKQNALEYSPTVLAARAMSSSPLLFGCAHGSSATYFCSRLTLRCNRSISDESASSSFTVPPPQHGHCASLIVASPCPCGFVLPQAPRCAPGSRLPTLCQAAGGPCQPSLGRLSGDGQGRMLGRHPLEHIHLTRTLHRSNSVSLGNTTCTPPRCPGRRMSG